MKFPMRLPQIVSRRTAAVALRLKKSSPEICLISGLVAGAVALVKVGTETWKNKETIENDIKNLKTAKEIVVNAKDDERVDKDEAKKELGKSYVNLGKDICKTYWKPAVLSAASAGFFISGNRILRKQLATVTTAYALLYDSFNKYRSRVISDLGKEKDEEYMYGTKKITEANKETGEIEEHVTAGGSKYNVSRYSRWFDEGVFDSCSGQWIVRNYCWRDNPLINAATIKSAQVTANNMLQANGYLFLNDVYKLLGLPMSVDGQIVGWDIANGGDGYIDFGVFPEGGHQLLVNKAFIEGKTPNALLDFNVDGPILGSLEQMFGKDETMKLISERW